MNVRDDPAPSSSDLEAWRDAVANDRLRSFKLEVLVAALQDLGPRADRRIRQALALRLSDALMKLLRKRVGRNHPNGGIDIIERVHSELLTSLLSLSSADGAAMRTAFIMVVNYRVKDAIATEYKHSRIPTAQIQKSTNADSDANSVSESEPESSKVGSGVAHRVDDDKLVGSDKGVRTNIEPATAYTSDSDEHGYSSGVVCDPSLMDGVRDIDESIDVKRILSTITDERKRLAFYLYMDRIPIHSTKGHSIAAALGVDRKTVKKWISEVQDQLSQLKEVNLLESASSGGRQ